MVWLGFSVGIESDLVFVRGIEIDGVLAKIIVLSVMIDGLHFGVGSGGRNCLVFEMRDSNGLVLV